MSALAFAGAFAVVTLVGFVAVVILVFKNRDRIVKEVQREKAQADAVAGTAQAVVDVVKGK